MSSDKRFGVVLLALGFVATGSAADELDLAALVVTPERGQSAEQMRRDRYECHNWAVDQSGVIPAAPGARDERHARGERAARVISGATLGGTLGGLVRSAQGKRSANGVLAGAAIGAGVAAATGRDHDGLDEDSRSYLRALSACMEGRGYSIEA